MKAYWMEVDNSNVSGFIEWDPPEQREIFEDAFLRPFFVFEDPVAKEVLEHAPAPLKVEFNPTKNHADVLPDFGPYVSSRLRDLIEELEPGIHMFHPVNVVAHPTGEASGTYHAWRNTQFIDCVDIKRTRWGNDEFGRAAFEKGKTFGAPRSIGIFREAVEGKHIWRGKNDGMDQRCFCSGDFKDRCKSLGVREFLFAECVLVDEPAIAAE